MSLSGSILVAGRSDGNDDIFGDPSESCCGFVLSVDGPACADVDGCDDGAPVDEGCSCERGSVGRVREACEDGAVVEDDAADELATLREVVFDRAVA